MTKMEMIKKMAKEENANYFTAKTARLYGLKAKDLKGFATKEIETISWDRNGKIQRKREKVYILEED